MGELHVEYVERSAANRIALLDDNEMDIECNASTVTEERQRFAAFSPPHFYTDTPYVARAEQKLCTLDALRGRSMVVVRGTVNVAMATAVSRERNLNLAFVIADSIQEAFDMVAEGHVAAMAMDRVLIQALIDQSSEPDAFCISEEEIGPRLAYGLMTRHNDVAFAALVAKALRRVQADPEFPALFRRWFPDAEDVLANLRRP